MIFAFSLLAIALYIYRKYCSKRRATVGAPQAPVAPAPAPIAPAPQAPVAIAPTAQPSIPVSPNPVPPFLTMSQLLAAQPYHGALALPDPYFYQHRVPSITRPTILHLHQPYRKPPSGHFSSRIMEIPARADDATQTIRLDEEVVDDIPSAPVDDDAQHAPAQRRFDVRREPPIRPAGTL